MIGAIIFICLIIAFLLSCSLVQHKYSISRRDSFIKTSIFTTTLYYVIIECCSFFNAINTPTITIILLIYIVGLFILWLKTPNVNRYSFFMIPSFLNKEYSFYFMVFITIIIFITGYLYPPNTWDSLSYHLSRIEHWIQNGNLNFYSTIIGRQLFSAPLAELLILQLRVATNSDYFSFTIQWFSYIGSLVVISNICKQLLMSNKQQLYACVFFATLPIAILEASSTQNDLVVCFWILCSIDRMITCLKYRSIITFVELGLSIGLAILTKGTAYVILAPLVIYFAYKCLKEYKTCLIKASITVCIILTVNTPHYVRTYQKYKTPIAAYPETKSNFTVESMMYAFVGNFYINIPIPLKDASRVNEELATVNSEIFPYNAFYVFSISESTILLRQLFTFHEDTVKNPLHFVLLIFCIVFILFTRKENNVKLYFFLFVACYLFFCFSVPWQPWITRLQLPLFAVFAPLFGFALEQVRYKFRVFLLLVCCLFSLLPTFFNFLRPIKSIGRGVPVLGLNTSYKSFLNTDRINLLLYSESLTTELSENLNIIVNSKFSSLDILEDGNDPEYFIWSYLKKYCDELPQINIITKEEHFNSDYIFIIDKTFIHNNASKWSIENPAEINCCVLKKDGNTYIRVQP